jgi:drug/metabolite transporter (DMT)-like permease
MAFLPLVAGLSGRQRSSVVNASEETGERASAGSGRRLSRGAADDARRAGWLALLVVWVLWGSTYFAIRVGVETLPPLLMAGTRYVVAGLLMYPFALRSGGPEVRTTDRPRASGWWSAVLVGTLLLAGGNGGVSVGERSVPSGLAALLVATVPLWLILIDRILNGTRIGLLAMAGLTAGVIGVGFLAGPFGGGTGHAGVGHGAASGSPGTGIVIILAASVSWALGTITSRRVPLPSRPLLATSMQMLAGGVVLLTAAAATGEFSGFDASQVSAASWLALAYLIGPGSIIAFSAYVVAVRRLPTATVGTYAYVNPIIAVLLGTSFLGETLTASMLAGGALIVVAVALVVRSQAAAAR